MAAMKSLVIFASLLALTSAAPQYLSSAAANPLPIEIKTAGVITAPAAPAPSFFNAPAAPVVPALAAPNAPALAAPNAPALAGTETKKVATIVKDERTAGDDGSYSVDFETSDGIVQSESGSPSKTSGSFIQQGSVSFTHPGGEKFDLKYVADENGFQPESANLPVAPSFPHPIPQFVLDQIAFATEEDKKAAEEAKTAFPAVAAPGASPVAAPIASPNAAPALSYSAIAPAPAPAPALAPAQAPAPPLSVNGFSGWPQK